jgi:hypothetical protein
MADEEPTAFTDVEPDDEPRVLGTHDAASIFEVDENGLIRTDPIPNPEIRQYARDVNMPPGPTIERDLKMIGWALFGAISCRVNMHLGEDGQGDKVVAIQAVFDFPKAAEMKPAVITKEFKVSEHPEMLLNVETWHREQNPVLIRLLGVHLVKYVDEMRRAQVADAALKAMERTHGSMTRLKQLFENLRVHGWEAMRREGYGV